jgi:RNA polymerase sigma-70 factor (ECF subfamily)
MELRATGVEAVFKEERGRILATLIRLFGDFDTAEDALAMALEAAVEQWPREGRPDNPRAWLVRAARNKAIDQVRGEAVARRHREEQQAMGDGEPSVAAPDEDDETSVQDDQLRLIFTCCHPALAIEAQVALTLRTLGGLSTEEIARAFLVPVATMAQRLVRAKQKIRGAGIPYRIPAADDLPERLSSVLAVVYLIFNEAYAATSGPALVREDLATEAIRLARLLCTLMPHRPDPRALLALLLLQHSRRNARVDGHGDVVLLEEQDRALWDWEQIREGLRLLDEALGAGAFDAYAIQAAIAAVHARAGTPGETDWRQIAGLYGRLSSLQPSPVVLLNHAVAVAMSEGPDRGLAMLDDLSSSGALDGYHLLPAARAALLVRLGRRAEAVEAYRAALALVGNDAERRFLERRMRELAGS